MSVKCLPNGGFIFKTTSSPKVFAIITCFNAKRRLDLCVQVACEGIISGKFMGMNKDKTQQNSLHELGKEQGEPVKKPKHSRLAISGMVLAALLGTQVVLTAWISLDMKLFPDHWTMGDDGVLVSSNAEQFTLFGSQAEASQKTSTAAVPADKKPQDDTAKAAPTSANQATAQANSSASQATSAPKETYAYSAPQDIQSWAASKAGATPEEVEASLVPTSDEIVEAVNESLEAEKQALLTLPDDRELIKFDALSQSMQPLEGELAEKVSAAIQGFSDMGCDVGFVLYDISSQQGISYNVDQSFFAASTIKAPFVSYALESVAAGDASFDEEIIETRTMEGTGIMAYDDRSTYSLEEVFANTLMHSDNTGYLLLQDRFSREAFGDWAAATGSGLDAGLFLGADGFPSATARMMALLWNKIASNAWTTPTDIGDNASLGQAFDPDKAPILDWMNNADESFIRAALADSAVVYSKAGYETPDYGAAAMNDCGLVVDEFGPYILIMLTNASFDDTYFRDNETYAIALIQALAEARRTEIVEQP